MSEEMLSPGEDATLLRGGGSSARKARVRAQGCHTGGGRQPGAFRARAGTPAARICPCAPGTCIHCLGPLAWGLDRSHGSPLCRGGRGSNGRPGSGLAGHPRGRHPRSGGREGSGSPFPRERQEAPCPLASGRQRAVTSCQCPSQSREQGFPRKRHRKDGGESILEPRPRARWERREVRRSGNVPEPAQPWSRLRFPPSCQHVLFKKFI